MVQIDQPPSNPAVVSNANPSNPPLPSGSVVEAPVPAGRGRVEMGTAQVDSDAVTQEAILADQTAPALPPGSGFADDEIQHDGPPPMADGGPMSPAPWQSERTAKTKQIALVIAVSVVGLIVAAGVFSVFVNSWSQSEDVATPDLASGDPSNDETDTPADEHSTADDSQPAPDEDSADPAAVIGSAETAAAAVADETAADASVQDPPPTETNVIGMSASPEIPLDLLPQSPIFGSATPTDDAGPEDAGRNEELGTLSAIPEDLRQFTDLLNVAGIAPQGPEVLESEPVEAVEVEAASVEIIDPMMIANPPEPIDIEVAMKFPVALNSRGYPASDFVLLLSQLTAVPIQLDWAAFDLLGTDVRRTHIPPRGLKTKGEHLLAVLETLNARSESDQSMLTITPTDEVFNGGVAKIADLNDFGDSQQSAASVLNTFLGREIQVGEGGNPQLNLGETREQQLFSVLATESLRRMRSLPGKVPDDVIRRWTASYPAAGNGPDGTDWSDADWGELDGGRTRPQVDAPISVAQMLRHTARLNQASCVINWADANRRQMSPVQLVMPLAGRGAAEMLAESLDPMGLQVRSVGKDFWWVGTAATYDRLSVIAWTSPMGDQRERFVGRLSQALVKAKVTTASVTHDPDSDRIILLVPRFILRQMAEIQSTDADNAAGL